MVLAACGTAADTPSTAGVVEGTSTSEIVAQNPAATPQDTAATQISAAAKQAPPTTTTSTRATAQTEPAPEPTTAADEPSAEGDGSIESDEADGGTADEGDATTLPQVTFPEASVRDRDAEAADLERRRSVIGLFERLRIEAEHRRGYDRDAIFPGWLYRNGRSTRERVLADEQRPDGTWFSAYDNTAVSSAGNLDIDHLVPLAEAWESGGHAWSGDTWTRFANDLGDPRSLIAVSSGSNRSKGSRDPHDWWPPQDGYRCQYAADWIAVKARWNLSADSAEQGSLDTQLASCTGLEFDFALPATADTTLVE